MLNSDSPQGIYAPLSQVMTDSESEEEIHNSTKLPNLNNHNNNHNHNYNNNNRQHQQQFQQQQLKQQNQIQQQYHQQYSISNNHNSQPAIPRTVPNHLNLSLNHNSGINMSMQNAYRSSINSGGLPRTIHHGSGSFSSFNSDIDDRQHIDADNVAILGVDDGKNEPMSTIRRICFFLSLLVCVITVIIFLWVVPCNDGSACPAPLDRIKTHNWLNNYTSIELKGLVNVVDGVRSWEKNLIFLYRGDVFFPEFKPNNKKRNGIISLISSSGATAWFDKTINEPMTIDCTLLDVDKNGKTDCLVLDEYGQLGVIDPVFGLWYWTLKSNQTSQKIDALDFPMILPDLDGDGVYEILLAGANKGDEKSRNVLQIISGRRGQPIGDGLKINDCDFIRKFQLDKTQTVSFNCVKNNTEAQRSKTISEIYSLITNKSIKQNLSSASKINQHRHYGQRKDTEAQRNIYQLSGKELIIENRGKCPENCNMTFSLTEMKNGQIKIIRNFTSAGMYGMVPAQWHFKNTKFDLSGFVIKFWKWENTTASSSQREKRNDDFDDNDFFSNNFNTFNRVILKRDGFTITEEDARVERSIANITKQKSGNNIVLNNYKMQRIKETVVLIIFNGAYTNIENTSQSNIVQFCRNEKNDVICQPDLNNQENSLLIADLDQDGSQELVSYYTTFISKDDEKKDWELVTYVQLLRLEAELPNLYEGLKHN